MPSRPIPSPPRILLIGLAVMSALCVAGGFAVSRTKAGGGHRLKSSGKAASATRGRPVGGTEKIDVAGVDSEGAEKLKAEYESEGYRVELHPVKQKAQSKSGYIVADVQENFSARASGEALSKVFHFPVSLRPVTPDKSIIQVGPVFASQAEAAKLSAKLHNLGYDWKVMPNGADSGVARVNVSISEVPANHADAVETSLKAQGLKIKLSHTP